jgi:enoyl-CoA hydratase/carnithine racemase
VRADEAHAMGILDRVVPSDEVEDNALQWAARLGAGAVVAMGLAKRAIDDGLGRPLSEGLDMEADAFVEVFGTDDARVGVASFLEHGPGKAKFAGR